MSPRKWYLRRLTVACFAVSAVFSVSAGCSGPDQRDDGIDMALVETLQLSDIAAQITPYDLSGPTDRGLAYLDAWLTLEQPNRADGHRLRAESILDLWIYGQVAAGVDDEGATAALAVLTKHYNATSNSAGAALEGAVTAASQTLREAVVARIGDDLALAGADFGTIEAMTELAAVDLEAADAPERFENWRESSDDARVRLMLTTLLFRISADSALDSTGSLLERFDWLCAADDGSDDASLVERCGYYCAELPDAPDIGPRIERDVYDLIEDDTPVDLDVVDGSASSPDETELTEGESLWFPTAGDEGYRLVEACGADYFGLPPTGGVVLLNPANYLDLIALSFVGDLLAGLELDLLRGDALTVLSSPVLATVADHFMADHSTGGRFEQELTSAALRFDPRLELPRGVAASGEVEGHEQPRAETTPEDRLVVVRSDGLSLALTPHLRLLRDNGTYEVVYAEADRGYHYPGADVLDFPRMNRIDPLAVDADRIPLLRSALAEMEAAIVALGWGDDAQSDVGNEPRECGVGPSTGISLLIDGATYFSTLRPVLGTLLDCGYDPIRLHVYDAEAGQLVDLRLDLTVQAPYPSHTLAVRNGTVLATPYVYVAEAEPDADAEPDAEPEAELASAALTVGRRQEAPMLALLTYLQDGVSTGSVDFAVSLAVPIEDERVDFGMLAQVILAIAYQRDLEGIVSDGELLSAPVLTEDGAPVPLFEEPPLLVLE